MKIFSRQRPKAPRVSHERLRVIYVCSGCYDLELEILTPDGRDQATMAAQVIRAEAEGNRVVVFRDHRWGIDFGPDRETAGIIANALSTLAYDSPFKYEPDSSDIRKMSDEYSFPRVSWFVRVVPRDYFNAMHKAYSGPQVQAGSMGPAYGSVHTLEIGLNGQGKIATKQFV